MPWSRWEDYAAGMYAASGDSIERIDSSEQLLSDPERFRETAREMIREWPHAARHNLRHMWTGRNAWVGQASCCYAHAANAAETRTAWGRLSNQQQRLANQIAELVRAEWERGEDAQALPGL